MHFILNCELEIVFSPQKQIGRKSAEIVRLGSKNSAMLNGGDELSDEDNDDSSLLPSLGEELHIDDQQTLEMVAQFAEQAVSKNSALSVSWIVYLV